MSEKEKQENGSGENAVPEKLGYLESFKARSNVQRFQSSHNIYKEFVVCWRAMELLRKDVDAMSGGEPVEHISVDSIEELKKSIGELVVSFEKTNKELKDELERIQNSVNILRGENKELKKAVKDLKK